MFDHVLALTFAVPPSGNIPAANRQFAIKRKKMVKKEDLHNEDF